MIATRVTHLTTNTNLRAGNPQHTVGALLAQGWVHAPEATQQDLEENGLEAILQHPQLAGDRLYVAAKPVEVADEEAGQ